jgi:hypothetical protein
VDRRFWTANGRQADFERLFGTGGYWSGLLVEASGYLGTEIWCESAASRQYRVRDLWSWHREFESFRDRFQLEFERFEELLRTEILVERQEFLGAYYEKSDDGNEEDLVLS